MPKCHTFVTLSRAYLEETGHMPFPKQHSMQKYPLHTPRISQRVLNSIQQYFRVLLMNYFFLLR